MDDNHFRKIKKLYKKNEENTVPAHSFENHVLEVYSNAKEILDSEDVDEEVVKYSALLHDVGRNFPHDKGHAEKGAEVAKEFLVEELGKNEQFAEKVSECIRHHSNRPHLDPPTREAEIVWAADKMHTTGATGLFRFLLTLGAKNHSTEEAIDILKERVSDAEERSKEFGFEELVSGLKPLKDFIEMYEEENDASD